MKKLKTLALLLIAGCAPVSVSAQRVINLNDENAGISLKAIPRGIEVSPEGSFEDIQQRVRSGTTTWSEVSPEEIRKTSTQMRIGNVELKELYPGEIKNFRPLAINPALKSPETVSVGDTIILELFEDQVYKAVVSRVETTYDGWFGFDLKLPPDNAIAGHIVTTAEGKSYIWAQNRFDTKSASDGQVYLVEVDSSKAPAPVPIVNEGQDFFIRPSEKFTKNIVLDEKGNIIRIIDLEKGNTIDTRDDVNLPKKKSHRCERLYCPSRCKGKSK